MTRIIDTNTEASSSEVVGLPEWIKPGLSVKTGRDPLGLQTITVDRIMPQLLARHPRTLTARTVPLVLPVPPCRVSGTQAPPDQQRTLDVHQGARV